jgi:hypothetical protein
MIIIDVPQSWYVIGICPWNKFAQIGRVVSKDSSEGQGFLDVRWTRGWNLVCMLLLFRCSWISHIIETKYIPSDGEIARAAAPSCRGLGAV